MHRRARLLLIVLGVAIFLGVSGLLARALGGRGAERAEVLDAVRAQAAGDVAGTLAAVPACRADPTCARLVRARAPRLRRPGTVALLTYDPSIGVTFTRQTGVGRVAWRTDRDERPVVQCVRVTREGPLGSTPVALLSLSDPIRGDASCPR